MKKTPFYVELANVIIEMETIDFESNNGDEYPTIHWLIAAYMLRNLSIYQQHMLIPDYAKRVQINFQKTVDYLEEKRGVNIYRFLEKDGAGKKIAVITTDKSYKEALEREGYRMFNRFKRSCRTLKIGVERRLPPAKGKKLLQSGIEYLQNN